MKKLAFAITVLLLVSPALSQSLQDENLKEFKQAYNDQSSQVPGFLGEIIGGERINVKLEVNSSNKTMGASFEGVEIDKISSDGIKDPTIEAWTDQETVKEIAESEQKYDTLQKKLDKKEINYKTTTLGAAAKVKTLEIVNEVVSLF
jgi:hypothetical protein